MKAPIDPKVRAMAEAFLATETNPRALFAIRTMLEKGFVTTDDIAAAGYVHTPRAIGDVRDAGIPVVTGKGTSTNGKRQAVYSFGRSEDIQEGRFGGRSAFSKAFKEALVVWYQSKDCITGATLDPKVLQIDHRIPYRVAGDRSQEDREPGAFMLLDGSSQRAKSWACEHCPNMLRPPRDSAVCNRCFWAFPESYDHIAMEHIRRADVVFQGPDVALYDRLKALADGKKMTVSAYLLHLLRLRV